MRPRLIIIILLLSISGLLKAEEKPDSTVATVRPVFAAYTAEFGSAHLTDTYLTPLKYIGWHTGLDYSRYQAMKFSPEKWTMRLHANIGVDKTDNPARNASMWSVMLSLDWGMMRKFHPLPGLTLAAGGSTGIDPASAKAAWTVNLTGYAAYKFNICKLPVTLMYHPTIPVTGVFFSPDYGELYYEIYLGDTFGLVHGAWWGNYFSLDNLLTADLHLGDTNLRIGYRGKIFSSEVNHITTNIFTHSLVLGISGDWISVNPRKGVPSKVSMIQAIY